MSYKKWLAGFVIIFLILILMFMFFNYKRDIYGYFGADEQISLPFGIFVRKTKMRHVSQNKDKYYGYILGGSKAGAIDATLVSKYEGKEFYNLSVSIGSFADYEAFTSYIAENTSAKKIILHLGNIELFHHTTTDMPATITGKKMDYIKEITSFLFTSPLQTMDRQFTKLDGSINYSNVEELVKTMGEQAYKDKYVMPGNATYLDYRTFYETANKTLPAFDKNLQSLQNIVQICNNNNIELKVIIGPTFVYELHQYEGDRFWSYLRGIASMTEFWDFSGFNDIGLNPCNFINTDHYNTKVADKMINIVYGKEENKDFGTYVQINNFDEYINNRMKKFEEMKQAYDETGKINLFDETHESFIK